MEILPVCWSAPNHTAKSTITTSATNRNRTATTAPPPRRSSYHAPKPPFIANTQHPFRAEYAIIPTMSTTTNPAATNAATSTSATPTAPQPSTTTTPTPEQVQALIARGHVRSALPPGPGKRPRGRPRKDGQPIKQTNAGKNAAALATAAALHIATHPLDYAGTPEHRIAAIRADPSNPSAACQFASPAIMDRVKRLEMTSEGHRARTFLEVLANVSYKEAAKATGASPCTVQGWKTNKEFAEIYAEIMKAHDAATIAKTCGTLAALANGEYKPTPDCLPPDMRAASLLMPALDPRFRPSGQTAAQQVQINIQI